MSATSATWTPKLGGLLAVQVHRQLRLPQDQAGVDVHHTRDLAEGVGQAARVFGELREVRAADVKRDLFVGHAAAGKGGHLGDAGAQLLRGELRQDRLADLVHDLELRPLPLSHVLELHEDRGEIGRPALIVPDQDHGVGDAGKLLDLPADPRGDQLGLLQGSPLRGAD